MILDFKNLKFTRKLLRSNKHKYKIQNTKTNLQKYPSSLYIFQLCTLRKINCFTDYINKSLNTLSY